MTARRGGRAFQVAALSCALSSCHLIGAGAGAGIDSFIPGPYETKGIKYCDYLRKGDRIQLFLRNGQRIEGRYLGTTRPNANDLDVYLTVETSDDVSNVKTTDVETIGVEVTGKGWLYGGLIGLAVDVAVIVYLAHQPLWGGQYSSGDWGGDW